MVLRLTITVERDYAARGVFPALRSDCAAATSGNATVHFLTPEKANAVLNDAQARLKEVNMGLAHAYLAHVANQGNEIQEAETRREIFASADPIRLPDGYRSERWSGTKEQLRKIGISIDGPYPGEPGGKRSVQTRDPRNYRAKLARGSTIWANYFRAEVEIPKQEQPAKPAPQGERAAEVARLQRDLEEVPKDADEFRLSFARSMRDWLFMRINAKPVQWHGWTLSDDAVVSICMRVDAIVDAIMEADVTLDQERQRQVIERHQTAILAADPSFKQHLAKLVTPNAAILEGEAS